MTNYQWYDINLPRTITFHAGSTYDVEFLPQGSSQWKGAYHWDYNQNRNDANWPVVLRLN